MPIHNMKKILSLLLVCATLVICFTGCSTQNTGVSSKGGALPVLKEITTDTVKNKALFIVDPSTDNSTLENMLANFSNKFNIAIEKVEYGTAWTTFENAQDMTDGTSSDLAIELENHFATIEDQELLSKLYEQFNNALIKIVETGDTNITEEMNAAHEILPDFPAEDYASYVTEVSKMYTSILADKVDPLNLPVLIVLADQEMSRINGISEHPEKFGYVATTAGLFDLEKTSSIDEVTKKIENADTFVAVFSTSTCQYCLDTFPIIERAAKANNIPVIEVNLASVKNDVEKLDSLLEKGYITSEISGTPTVYYYKDGKVSDTQTGAMTVTQVNSFFARNK